MNSETGLWKDIIFSQRDKIMVFKITSNFDADKLKKQMLEKGKEAMKKKFTDDIKKLAKPFGETPKISFVEKQNGYSVKVSNVSDELKEKINNYIKANSK